MRSLDEDVLHHVPSGKAFVVTGVGFKTPPIASTDHVTIQINGAAALVISVSETLSRIERWPVAIPPGLSAKSGDTIRIVDSMGQATSVLLGYEADE